MYHLKNTGKKPDFERHLQGKCVFFKELKRFLLSFETCALNQHQHKHYRVVNSLYQDSSQNAKTYFVFPSSAQTLQKHFSQLPGQPQVKAIYLTKRKGNYFYIVR